MYEVVDGAVERSSNQRPPSYRVSHWNPDWHSLIPDPVSPNSWQPPAVSLAYLAVNEYGKLAVNPIWNLGHTYQWILLLAIAEGDAL